MITQLFRTIVHPPPPTHPYTHTFLGQEGLKLSLLSHMKGDTTLLTLFLFLSGIETFMRCQSGEMVPPDKPVFRTSLFSNCEVCVLGPRRPS